jgi:hypothetical protein
VLSSSKTSTSQLYSLTYFYLQPTHKRLFSGSNIMAEVLGAISSLLAITSAAYTSSKSLYELVQGIRDAPHSFELLQTDVSETNRVLSRHSGNPNSA